MSALEEFLSRCEQNRPNAHVGGYLFDGSRDDRTRLAAADPRRVVLYYAVGRSNRLYDLVAEVSADGQPSRAPVLKVHGHFLLREAAPEPFVLTVGGYSAANAPTKKAWQ